MISFKQFLEEGKKVKKLSPLKYNNTKLPDGTNDDKNVDSISNLDNTVVPGFQGTRAF